MDVDLYLYDLKKLAQKNVYLCWVTRPPIDEKELSVRWTPSNTMSTVRDETRDTVQCEQGQESRVKGLETRRIWHILKVEEK